MESVSCVICRRRKIKCDRRPVTCNNCAKFGTQCSYVDTNATSASGPGVGPAVALSTARGPPVAASATTTQAGLQRRRILRSCTACKRAKAKCSGGASCTRCMRRSVRCVYEGGRRDVDAGKAETAAGPERESSEPGHPIYPETYSDAGAAPRTVHPGRPAIPGTHEQTALPTTYAATTPAPSFPLHTHPLPLPHPHPRPSSPQITSSPAASRSLTPSGSTPVAASASSFASASAFASAPLPVPPWLVASSLPSMDRLRSLIDSFFARVHPLRCLGFLHTPTFHERLRDQQTLYYDSYGLVHAICALAAPFVYAAETAHAVVPSGTAEYCFFDAGHGWAATAMMRIFHHIGTPDIDSLMTEMLLHEYYLRCGEYAKAFMLSGLVARHIQLLQLNLEHDLNPPRRASEARDDGSAADASEGLPWATKESRRRLVWCCYLQDAFMECGIDQLRFVNPADIQVQLPCTEELFVRGKPCVTEMLQPGKLLPFVAAADVDAANGGGGGGGGGASSASALRIGGAVNLDLRAFYIRAMAIRAKILKYVKHLQGDIPWSKDPRKSRFLCLDKELRALEASVPDDLRMSPENTAFFRWSGWSGSASGGSSRLGLYFGVHILLAQTFNDLYRVGVENLVFPHHATQWIRTNAPLDFLVECHRMCSTKAAAIASLLEEVWQTDRLSLVDTPYAMHAQVCSSVMVMTMISWQSLCQRQKEQLRDGGAQAGAAGESSANLVGPLVDPQMVPVTPVHRRLLESNLTILDFLRCYIKADLYYESAKQALKRFEQLQEAARNSKKAAAAAAVAGEPAPTPTDAPQFSLEYILNPLGVYPMARQQARNRHEPQSNPPPPAEPSPSPAIPRGTPPLAALPVDQVSAPVFAPASPLTPVPPVPSVPSVPLVVPATAPVPVPVLNTPNMQGIQSVPGTPAITPTTAKSTPGDSSGRNSGAHGMVHAPAPGGMQPGMMPPQTYYQQRTMPMYDAAMSGISGSGPGTSAAASGVPATAMGNAGDMDTMGDMSGMGNNMNDGLAGGGNSMDMANMINVTVGSMGMGTMSTMSSMGTMNMGMGHLGMDAAAAAAAADAADGSEPAMFNMWNWGSEAPSMDNMGYPTFLEAFQVN